MRRIPSPAGICHGLRRCLSHSLAAVIRAHEQRSEKEEIFICVSSLFLNEYTSRGLFFFALATSKDEVRVIMCTMICSAINALAYCLGPLLLPFNSFK